MIENSSVRTQLD